MGRTGVLIATTVIGMLAAGATATLLALPVTGQTVSATLVGAGDIAGCSEKDSAATARLLGRIPGTVFTVGDNVQGRGASSEFRNCYDPTWGKYKQRTKPAAGNHEYYTARARPYFDYFGARAGGARRGYYSYDRGGWHVVVLNSNCSKVGGCGRTSPQGRWLRTNLARNDRQCTMAYFHHPLYASGTGSDTPQVRPFWNMLQKRRADVILSGHAHRYERFRPITPAGARSPNGIRQFIVGTGGATGGKQYGPNDPNMQVKRRNTAGVLRFSLRPGSYSWRFVPISGQNFTDSGTDRCH